MSMEDFIGYARGASSRPELEDPLQRESSISLLHSRVKNVLDQSGQIERLKFLTIGYTSDGMVFRFNDPFGGRKQTRLFCQRRTILPSKDGVQHQATVRLMTDYNLISASERPTIGEGDDLIVKVEPDLIEGESLRGLTFTLGKLENKWQGNMNFDDESAQVDLGLDDCTMLNLLLDRIE